MAHMKPASSRAIATVTTWACVPRETSRRSRVQSLTWAFQQYALEAFGWLCESPLQRSAHLGWVALGPGAFDQGPSGMGVAGFGHRPLPAWLTGGIFRGNKAQSMHQFTWLVDAGEITQLLIP